MHKELSEEEFYLTWNNDCLENDKAPSKHVICSQYVLVYRRDGFNIRPNYFSYCGTIWNRPLQNINNIIDKLNNDLYNKKAGLRLLFLTFFSCFCWITARASAVIIPAYREKFIHREINGLEGFTRI